MRTIAVVTGSVLLMLLAGGCASFPGEWVETERIGPDGIRLASEGQRRAALRFEWPSTVRYGAYDNLARVVDHQVVQSDTYFTMQGGKVAQFGAIKARVKGDRLDAYIGGDTTIVFKRVKGDSVFPSPVILPSLGRNVPPAQPIDPLLQPVPGEPVLAAADELESV